MTMTFTPVADVRVPSTAMINPITIHRCARAIVNVNSTQFLQYPRVCTD